MKFYIFIKAIYLKKSRQLWAGAVTIWSPSCPKYMTCSKTPEAELSKGLVRSAPIVLAVFR